MWFYIICILGGDAAIIFFNIFFKNSVSENSAFSDKFLVIAGLLLVVFCIALDGISAFLIRRLPEKWFSYNVKIHKPGKKECKIYERLGIKLWKDHILELGMFTAFSKKHVANPESPEYIERFILESNYGVLIHLTGVFIGFLLLCFYPKNLLWRMSFPAAMINAFMNIFPLMILRYNLLRLHRMHAVLLKKRQRKNGGTLTVR